MNVWAWVCASCFVMGEREVHDMERHGPLPDCARCRGAISERMISTQRGRFVCIEIEKTADKTRRKKKVKVSLPLLPVSKTCQNCLKRADSTRRRSVYSKHFTGPCGDSFCYASCDSPSCRPVDMSLCWPCAQKLSKPGFEGTP